MNYIYVSEGPCSEEIHIEIFRSKGACCYNIFSNELTVIIITIIIIMRIIEQMWQNISNWLICLRDTRVLCKSLANFSVHVKLFLNKTILKYAYRRFLPV